MKNNTGVTLVEMIVVAVLIAVLAAVGIPIYSGYVRDQRQSTVNNLAETAAASANSYLRRTGNSPANVNVLQLYYNASKYSVTINSTAVSVVENGTSINATASYN
jgi:prepilin-type N-terminal cleavage/methylation domain-containing protein